MNSKTNDDVIDVSHEEIIDELKRQNKLLPATTTGVTIDTLALMEPEKAQMVMKNRITALQNIRAAAIGATQPSDWVGFRDKEGNVAYLLSSSGAVNVRKYYGISIFNIKPDKPELFEDENGVKCAEVFGDAHCGLTGETIESLRGFRRSDEHFTGRGTDEDLRQSARTSLESKAVRILAGMTRVTEDELKACRIDTSKCKKGSGFGSSSERSAGKVAEPDVKENAKALGDEILKRVGGDKTEAQNVLTQITANPEKDFAGFRSIGRLTMGWQVDNAWKKLKTHSTYGDNALNKEQDNGKLI